MLHVLLVLLHRSACVAIGGETHVSLAAWSEDEEKKE